MRALTVLCLGYMFMTAGQLSAQEPELPLSEAIQIALENNRPANIAKLDIDKAQWQVASTKTKRYPAISTYLFGSANLTSPSFNFKAGTFQTPEGQPVPATDTKISLSQGFTGYTADEVSQPSPSFTKSDWRSRSRNWRSISHARNIGASSSPWLPT